MNKKKINQILLESNLDFKQTEKSLYINFIYGFDWDYNYTISITKGLYEYHYYCFYEVMIWYRYYTCKYHNIKSRIENRICNSSYFARIPHHYRSTSPKKGLNIIKEAIILYINHYNGIPNYFTMNELDRICYLR